MFIAGLSLGWGPCLYFCAPIIFTYIGATQKHWLGGLKLSLTFSFARIIAYVTLSLISATLGSYLIKRFYQTQAGMISYVIAGSLISFLGIIIIIDKAPLLQLCRPFKKTNLPSGIKEMFLLGLLLGFAPCLPLLGVLAYIAFHSSDPFQGTFLGFIFALGTIISPLILLGPLAGSAANLLVKKELAYKIFIRLCGLTLLYLGIGMIVRVLMPR